MEEVRYERVGAAAVLTIDRPERRNAVDAATARALRAGFESFEADDDARALVLTGGGGEAFCAGADLKSLDLDVDDPAGPMGFSRLAASKPTIAAIDGWCLAGGLELALWCDLRLATPGSIFGLFERRWGGLGRALDLILAGRAVDAEEAERIGLITAVTAPGAHLARALELAESLAAFPQETMLADRRATIEGVGLPFEEGLALEHRLGRETLEVAARGASRFAAGEGRHGAPADSDPSASASPRRDDGDVG
jgi:enoyl-CoA hydratase